MRAPSFLRDIELTGGVEARDGARVLRVKMIGFCEKTMPRIASRVSQLNGEGALAVYSRAKELERAGRSIIHLELGEPDFHPAAPVVDALRAAVAEGRDRYVATRGIPALREAIAEYLKRDSPIASET